MCRTYHLLPHQVLAAEQLSLRNRLEDLQQQRTLIQQQLESVSERGEFNHLLKTELPQINNLIDRITNELHRLSIEYQAAHQQHLHNFDPTVFASPDQQSGSGQP